jgi:hypothetical protein
VQRPCVNALLIADLGSFGSYQASFTSTAIQQSWLAGILWFISTQIRSGMLVDGSGMLGEEGWDRE